MGAKSSWFDTENASVWPVWTVTVNSLKKRKKAAPVLLKNMFEIVQVDIELLVVLWYSKMSLHGIQTIKGFNLSCPCLCLTPTRHGYVWLKQRRKVCLAEREWASKKNLRWTFILIWGHLGAFKFCRPQLGDRIHFAVWTIFTLRSGTDNDGAGLIFRQGSSLFCRTGLRSCNFAKPVQPPMLTGNVCCSECIQAASTNKRYITVSTLWLQRESWFQKKEGKSGNLK